MALLSQKRAYLVYGSLVFALGLILARAWFLQIVLAERNLERIGWSMEQTVTLNVPRGAIRDRNGVPFAESVEAYNLIFDPRAFYMSNAAKADELAQMLGQLPDFNAEEFLAYAELPVEAIPRYKLLARNLAPNQAEAFGEAFDRLGVSNSFRAEQVFRRFYPMGEMAGGLLGFINRDGIEGQSGLERGLNDALHGSPVRYRVTRDSARAPYLLEDVPDLRASRGKDVELTLDMRLQRAAEEALQRAIDKHRAKEAMAIVSDIQTGEILALAAVPTIDPNRAFSYDESLIWGSHAVTHAHEPGSTAKILTFAAAIDAGVLRYDTPLDCENGRTVINNRTIRDTVAKGIIPAWEAFKVSSNVCAWKMAQLIGAERHREYLVAFGLGNAPNLPITGMTRGILPPLRWIDVQHANISFGYAMSTSALQMHMAVATLANGGVRMEPRIVAAIIAGDGTREEFEPISAGPVVKPSTAREVLRAMEEIVHGEGGTGWRATLPHVRIAAKTGTARTIDPDTGRYQNRYLASFAGVFPVDAPKYAITVWVVHPDNATGYYGGEVAAPVFREIGNEVLRLYGTPPSTWSDSVQAAARALPDEALAPRAYNELPEIDLGMPNAKMPNLVGLRARTAIELLREEGLEVAVYGSGIIAGHQPSAGAPVQRGQRILLQLEEPTDAP